MIAAIMQPYFFPYIGYFQLMRAVDVFVFYDDVQYMKGGWINRNRILGKDGAAWLTLPVQRDSISLNINQRSYLLDGNVESVKRQLHAAYVKAPEFCETSLFVNELLDFADSNVAAFNINLLVSLARKLDIGCKFVTSSAIEKPHDIKGEARVIDLCRRVGADRYINPLGGRKLYKHTAFLEHGIQLDFLDGNATYYAQFGAPHLPSLSIIDVLMFNSLTQARALLADYRLFAPAPQSVP